MEKLDSFSKILLATASINYMSSCVNGVVQQMKMIPKAANIDDVKRSMIDKGEGILAESLERLKEVMEDIGNYMSNEDCICAIDEYITTPAFNILIHVHDDTDGDFDSIDKPEENKNTNP